MFIRFLSTALQEMLNKFSDVSSCEETPAETVVTAEGKMYVNLAVGMRSKLCPWPVQYTAQLEVYVVVNIIDFQLLTRW